MDKNIRTYLKIYKGFFTPQFCADTVNQIIPVQWDGHIFYDYQKNDTLTHDKDLKISNANIPNRTELQRKLWSAIRDYFNGDISPVSKWYASWSGYTPVRFNKYETGTCMLPHCDHIHSMFDGHRKGIPTLTILGALNDDYTGGELVFWEDETVELKAGDLAIFPSNFLYPHEVKEVTSGTRYSFVSWVW